MIPLPKGCTLVLPDDYKKLPLPGLIEWVAALRTRTDRGTDALCRNGEYCCLGVLSQLQGRLTEDGRDIGCHLTGCLAESNPAFPVLQKQGDFPRGVVVWSGDRRHGCLSLAIVNDDLETGEGWEIIPDLLEHLYYDPASEPQT